MFQKNIMWIFFFQEYSFTACPWRRNEPEPNLKCNRFVFCGWGFFFSCYFCSIVWEVCSKSAVKESRVREETDDVIPNVPTLEAQWILGKSFWQEIWQEVNIECHKIRRPGNSQMRDRKQEIAKELKQTEMEIIMVMMIRMHYSSRREEKLKCKAIYLVKTRPDLFLFCSVITVQTFLACSPFYCSFIPLFSYSFLQSSILY